jgi:hypothetical protein
MRVKLITRILVLLIFCFSFNSLQSQDHSVARQWNEILLEGIRNDFARPIVHARNLFHVSAAMYDAFAVFDENHTPYFLGQSISGYEFVFDGFTYDPALKNALRDEAISHAVYRIMLHRFRESPDYILTLELMNRQMNDLGLDIADESVDYGSGSGAALGNYIAQQVIAFGLQDGSNEAGDYEGTHYTPINEPLNLSTGGDNPLVDPNRWQALMFGEPFIDQSGNVIAPGVVDFLGPEWGNVVPFALDESDKKTFERDGNPYVVYVDPGAPPSIDSTAIDPLSDIYKWGFALVAAWSSHLDPYDGVTIDISPGSLGDFDLENLPADFDDYKSFYDFENGSDASTGRMLNPYTNLPYESNEVPMGDYARVLAEFWADGPDSETPPGHWFTILNVVNDHPLLQRKFEGKGEEMDPLEWDIKAYFLLGGAMHDAAISAWSVKGYYDYVRPISAIRYMATLGQSSNVMLENYHPNGLPLIDGLIEVIKENDPLVGGNLEFLGEIKLLAWRGHDVIGDTETDEAGVGWILAKDWWPYQRPSFVTPPFAGYVSGHSTYSRAAAEVLTRLTGSEFFPGGMGVFFAPKNQFLVFEDGPSVDVMLQWATYYDAADQCSLSRIWGGIHPPMDDLNGRRMGAYIGLKSFDYGKRFFHSNLLSTIEQSYHLTIFPNPVTTTLRIASPVLTEGQSYQIINLAGQVVSESVLGFSEGGAYEISVHLTRGVYHMVVQASHGQVSSRFIVR